MPAPSSRVFTPVTLIAPLTAREPATETLPFKVGTVAEGAVTVPPTETLPFNVGRVAEGAESEPTMETLPFRVGRVAEGAVTAPLKVPDVAARGPVRIVP